MKNKKVVAAAVALAVVLALVVGGGFYNGNRVKSYAQTAEGIYNETIAKWSSDLENTGSEGDFDAVTSKIEEIKKKSEENLARLNSMSTPTKAKDLSNDMKAYFELSKKTAENVKPFLNYFNAFTAAGEALSGVGTDLGGTSGNVADFQKAKDDLDKVVKDLKSTTPPDAFKSGHDEFVKTMEDFSDALGDFIAAYESEDVDAMTAASQALSDSMTGLYDVSGLFDESAMAEIVPQADTDKMEELDGKIKSQIGTLKQTSFLIWPI